MEKIAKWVAEHLPRQLTYWSAMRLFVHATSGQWSDQEVPALTMMEALDRWEQP